MKLTQYQLLKERLTIKDELNQRLWQRALGDQGEQWFNAALRSHLPEDWVVLEDLWIAVDGHCTQIDCLIVTPREWWVVNVKNHAQTYTYRDGQWLDGQELFFTKMYNQVRRSEDALIELSRRIFKKGYQVPLRSSLVFVHPRGRIFIEEGQGQDLEIASDHWLGFLVDLYRLRRQHQDLIWQAELDEQVVYPHYEVAQVVQAIRAYQIPKPDYTKLYPVTKNELLERGQSGIFCCECRRLYKKKDLKKLHCSCGSCEAKSSAVLRTIHEFMIITDCQQVTSGEIRSLIGEIVAPQTIRRVLSKYFVRKGVGRGIYYEIKSK